MKIACIGNMNNILFTLCRYLRDEGFDAHLLLFDDEASHFLPEADTYTDDYLAYTIQLPVGKSTLHRSDVVREATRILAGFDFLIGTDVAPALATLAGRKLDIFVPHGSDIYAYPFEKKPNKTANRVWWLQAVYYVGRLQKIGVEQTDLILFPDEYDKHFPFKQKLNTTGVYRSITVPMLYVPQYRDSASIDFSKLPNYEAFMRIRRENDFVVFSHARQNGPNLPPHEKIHEKGNHKLIGAFARFVAENPDLRSCLVLFEYGMNIDAAKQQIASLNIADKVAWMPKMARKEILFGLRLADIGCGEFENSWLTCGVVNETLAVGKPLLHYRDDDMYRKDFPELYPILNAREEDEILEQLRYFRMNRNEINDRFKAAPAWIEQHTVLEPVKIIAGVIRSRNSANRQHNKGLAIRLIRINYLLKRAVHQAPGKLRRIFSGK